MPFPPTPMRKRPGWWIRWNARRVLRFRIDPDAMVRELRTLPPALFVDLYWILQVLNTWLTTEVREGMYDADALIRREEAILLSGYDPVIRDTLAVMVRHIAAGATPDQDLAWACMAAAEWAKDQGFLRVMLAFTHYAAHAADSVHFYLIAELTTVSVDLSLAPPEEVDLRRELHARWTQLAEMVTARGGMISLTSMENGGRPQAAEGPLTQAEGRQG